ncbi:cell division cycle protein 20 homolog [Drosophila miranda]|uniref:cell division cycle protein 20 homolog n=1 Tax=Drosophila miranda TaxID=7229 RepID=UPI00143FAA97|nr:cell division cycle protein 20 homolog [Drosophila miranda]
MDADGETPGPSLRWKKKLEAALQGSGGSTTRSDLSIPHNGSYSGLQAAPTKTPGKSSGSARKSKKSTKTPDGGDRFIPNRTATNFELAHFLMNQESGDKSDENSKGSSKKATLQKLISQVAQVPDSSKARRVLCYQNRAAAGADQLHANPPSSKSIQCGSRYIQTTPELILDAPLFINDFYLNLLDWSGDNIVAIGLGHFVYLWYAAGGAVKRLTAFAMGDYASSVAWSQEGQILAIGHSSGVVELWDCSVERRLRVMRGHRDRVGCLAWNSFLVSSGSRDGTIIHHDVRSRDHKISSLAGHSQGVCGLKWSTDFKYLASGGNDNLVNVWSLAGSGVGTATEALHKFSEHQGAVRALAWCPWQASTLATGGGTADRCIKLWSVSDGSLIKSFDSKSQVCALLFSGHYKELISAHGFADNQLTIWKYPMMAKQADLTGHSAPVLQMAMSPDGRTVISAGADETVRFWPCFAPDPLAAKKPSDSGSCRAKQSLFGQSIR